MEIGRDPSREHLLLVHLSGDWRVGGSRPSINELRAAMDAAPEARALAFDTRRLGAWDSLLLTFLMNVKEICAGREIEFQVAGLPGGVERLLSLALAVPERDDGHHEVRKQPFLTYLGKETVGFLKTTGEMLSFVGVVAAAFGKLAGGKAMYRRSDLVLTIQQCGAQALPIVCLISLLVGLILALVGVIQLQLFGVEIYIADLVGIAMVRVMGAVMAGIIMAGRTGAAFAAQLGTMETGEEIDAMKTLGISPVEFLVLPRVIGLTLMMPLLCLYADLMGILGGAIVGIGLMDINAVQYYHQSREAIDLANLFIGLFHSLVFGVLVALAGCLRGLQCGRSASAVGDAATSAVVTGIVAIVMATAVITGACNVIGI
jgi:phospholipid/cholesterol/gamma-HCH transport system permease protein